MTRLGTQDRRYTRDLGVFVLDEAKFQKNFKGNYVYLGAFCSSLSLFLIFIQRK